MSEIKFACPHCAQHIACDDMYCGERIKCPGCKGPLFIPPLAASIPMPSGRIALAMPVAAKEKMQAHPVAAEPWGEAEWENHVSRGSADSGASMLPFWVLLVLPFFAAFLLLTHRAGVRPLVACFVVCALIAGFYLAKLHANSLAGTLLRGFFYSIGVVMLYFVLSLGLLFVGCLLMLK